MKTNLLIRPQQVIAVMGEIEDTNGASVVAASIITLDPRFDANHMMYFLATPKGVAIAQLDPSGYYSSTHCMPLDKAIWMHNNWKLDITTDIRNQVKSSITIAQNLRTKDDLEKALIVAKAF